MTEGQSDFMTAASGTQETPARAKCRARTPWSGAFALILASAALLTAGCSSFSREWRAAEQPAADPAGIAGRWTGTWQNTNNTHSDRMRAVVTPVSATEYRVHFHAKYRKVLGFKYSATFHGETKEGVFVFRGEEDLGVLAGGLYRYTGRIQPTNFFSTYDSKYDSGTFTLHRP